ncbi:SIR2 family protein [Modestobacter sp. I12A-02628]|uniref:SIR2 family protein n=1 Tax=Goekera deserti TaxID=2497753 RepID=A0A7K3WBW6_9ACTN|nr:SIR2 family protein [Goekera deserti]MPQ98385.1 SIR2 family protein [Goekera deserti]NDI48212.1 SIR2 family protein [Goekera deserti]NEL53961.1 SIR2 family protein [Goekera deserti]
MTEYLEFFPAPFLEDLVQGRCLPFIGAGFSVNATLPPGKKMPDWDSLGRAIAAALPDYEYSNALEGLSAYSHEFSRVKLVEAIAEELHTSTIQPGRPHEEFCRMPFDRLVTTNWDFLLEEAYARLKRYCMPVLSEDQLAVANAAASVKLLKMHGDLHHPGRMVVTEDDYDAFIGNFPLMSTYLSSLLIDRTAFFIGYSLDDPDLRQIWHIVKDRLGSLRRPAYVLQIGAAPHARARFERRGVKVINLPSAPGRSYGDVLSIAFRELREYWSEGIISRSTATEPESKVELALPRTSQSRLVFFSVPTQCAAMYKEHVYPIAERWGFAPVMAADVVAPGDNLMAKIYALINKASLVLVDLGSPNTAFEAGLAASGDSDSPEFIFVGDEQARLPGDVSGLEGALVSRADPESSVDWAVFLRRLDHAFHRAFEVIRPKLDDEPTRLLKQGEYRAAVLASFSLLEHELRRLLERSSAGSMRLRRAPILGAMIQDTVVQDALPPSLRDKIATHYKVRNEIAHTDRRVSAKGATVIVMDVAEAVNIVRRLMND